MYKYIYIMNKKVKVKIIIMIINKYIYMLKKNLYNKT